MLLQLLQQLRRKCLQRQPLQGQPLQRQPPQRQPLQRQPPQRQRQPPLPGLCLLQEVKSSLLVVVLVKTAR
jgi:hypothetical protein